ncbi:MAG: tetrahydromethanopterin-linked C1 transfer pathway [Pirellulales bacterium]|nr:tetrahydromethanopterin-linked C1 transfer pathway [Pirellulales bacterium]
MGQFGSLDTGWPSLDQRHGGRKRVSRRAGDDIVGVDVGGANLKYATAEGAVFSRRFAMWRHWQELSAALATDLKERFAGCRSLAVTMTGELADCFADRAEGVSHIARQVVDAATVAGISDVSFYAVDGRFLSAPQACQAVDLVAAANWHALASYVGGHITANAILVDVGSTTTDIIPIRDGQVATTSTTDHQRLCQGELVYVGCRRTPVCALVEGLNFDGQKVNVMKELFATIDDVRLVLGLRAERADDRDTADGKPRTGVMAANRLARMIGLDHRAVDLDGAAELAAQIHEAARQTIASALARRDVSQEPVVISGHGKDLIPLPPETKTILLAERLGAGLSRCAPSYAVAQLRSACDRRGVREEQRCAGS